MRCAECGVETGQVARFCSVCGAPAGQRSPAAGPRDSPAGDAADLAQWARRAGSARFTRTRLRPGYDLEEVDAFLEAIRDTFLGVRQSPLTADEIRDSQFSTTHPFRPGYDEKEVDAFLDEVEARLRMRCAECGAPVTGVTQACAECGAPPVVRRPAADPAAAGMGVDRETAAPAARDARRPPAWIRRGQRYFMISLIFFLVLFGIGMAWLNKVPGGTGLNHALGWVTGLSVIGTLLSLILLVLGVTPRSPQQVTWAFVPILSLSYLAFAPFLWLAVIRRRARDWAVLAAYLAAVAAEIALASAGYQGSTAWSISYAMIPLVAGTAAIHVLVAYRPGAGPATFREARAARAAREHQEPVTDTVAVMEIRAAD